MLENVLAKKSGKITLNQLQKICGFLNFLGKAIVLGRAFTRCLYASTADTKLKPHHHIRINSEMKHDFIMWKTFIQHPSMYSRPFMDFTTMLTAVEIDMYSDASKNPELGMGGCLWECLDVPKMGCKIH